MFNKNVKYYRSVLEGYGRDTDSAGFYSEDFTEMYNTANPNLFGYIIVKKDMNGYHEIITGEKIPVIEFKTDKDNITILITPRTAYRVRNLVPVDNLILDNYLAKNNNEEFKERLYSFINEAKANKEEHKKLIRKM